MNEMEARLHAVAAKRWRIAIWLSVIMLIVYYGFILLVAFDKPLLATIVGNGCRRDRCTGRACRWASCSARW